MSHTFVIFGASGDLTSRKLVPALYRLFLKGRLPADARIVGFSRTPYEHDAWRNELGESTKKFVGDDFDPQTWQEFAKDLYYHSGDVSRPEDFVSLGGALEEIEDGGGCTRVYYLATGPRFFEPAIKGLGGSGLAVKDDCQRRIVVEKPFGTDLASAQKLNETLHGTFSESQIFRIDHYLGKETVQNMLVQRFANTIFEPVWNRNYIDHVQITAAEEVGVGSRGAFYETAGVLRDMFQNHLLQLLTFTAMEAPSHFEAEAVHNEKAKVLRAVRQYLPEDVADNTFRAQYRGYLDDRGVAADSQTATFAAIKLLVDNWRWQGVPFYLRSGKAMDCRSTQIVIQFREPPHMMFEDARRRHIDANRLVIQIQPAEGVQLHFQTKVPDQGMKLRLTDLEFRFDSKFGNKLPDAYERLLLDTLSGDTSLFARSDEVELQWKIIDPVIQSWQETGLPELVQYDQGSWGPPECSKWIWRDKRDWLDVCPVLK